MCLLLVVVEIVFDWVVEDVFEGDVVVDGEEFDRGMNGFVDEEVGMKGGLFLGGGW